MRRSYAALFCTLVVCAALAANTQATFTCTVLSAQDGSVVPNALCSLRSTDETVLFGSGYTDTNGVAVVAYDFTNDAPVSYLARIGHTGFYVAEQVLSVPASTADWSISISVSPLLNTSSVRAVLRWGSSPADLDSHIYLDSPSFPDCTHVYYSNKECLGGQGGVNLDLDDTTGYGPETTTFSSLPVGRYSYWIWIYSSGVFGDSIPTPTVEIYTGSTGNGVFKTYTVPTGTTDRAWHVFDVIVAESSAGCTAVTISDVNSLATDLDSTLVGPSTASFDLTENCGGSSSVCNTRYNGDKETCGNFGDPHIVMWNRTGVTCRAEGTSLLIDNEWFSLGMHNIQVDTTTGATATDLIRFIYKRCNPMSIEITPTSFPAPINSEDAGLHTIRQVGNNLYLDGIDTRIQVRASGDYLIFGISTPFWEGPGLCSGCAPGDSLDTSNPISVRKDAKVGLDLGTANATCRAAGLTEFWLDACIFDLVITGDEAFVDQATNALLAYSEVQEPFVAPQGPVAPVPTGSASSVALSVSVLIFAALAVFGF